MNTATGKQPRPIGLYLHVPFCSAICNYCNFNRGLFDGPLKDRYVEALLAEIDQPPPGGFAGPGQHGVAARRADSIYFGGGTPSLLDPVEIGRLLARCRESFDVCGDVEVTLEANPETVTTERLAQYRQAGVNRLSLGVQSFRDEELTRLSRLHGADRAAAAVGEARTAGFVNVSLDLMMWLPGQRVSDWLESVDRAVALNPDHLSLYLLELYPNAPLRDEMARRSWSQAPDEDAADMYVTAMERLDRAGLRQYEISNVARPGRPSRHNLKYWTDGEWLGFGCGAHSTLAGARWRNVSGTEEYIARIGGRQSPVAEHRCLTGEERLGDALFTGLRLTDGLDEARIEEEYGVRLWSRYGPDLERFVADGLLEHEAGRLRLTRRGMLLAHEIMMVFV